MSEISQFLCSVKEKRLLYLTAEGPVRLWQVNLAGEPKALTCVSRVAVAWPRLFFLCISLKMFTAEEKATLKFCCRFQNDFSAGRQIPIYILTTPLTDEMANR